MPAKTVKLAARVTLVYSLLAALWILVSDWLVQAWFPEALEITYFQTCKGLAFVGVTALLLYVLVREQLRKHEAEAAERQRAEVKLRESESQFRQITESLPQLVWTCTPDGECDFLSQQWVEFTGVPAQEQLGRRWLQQIHADDHARIAAAWQASVASGLPFQTEFRIRHRDGTYRWFDNRAVPLRNATGHIVKWYGANTDIQAQHALRESLRASEEKLRAIFEVEPQCLQLLEADGTLREINPAGLAMLEVESPAAVLGQAIFPSIVPADHANVRAALEATARGEKRALEFRIQGGRGNLRWMEMNTVPFHDPATGKAMILGVSRDITERRRAEQQVIQSEMQLQLVWEHALLALRLADAEGNTVLANPAYCEIVGKPRAELEGQPFAIAYAEKDRNQALADYRRRFQNHVECRQRPAEVTYWNGRRAQLEVSDSFLEITGEPTLLLTLINDVTSRKQAQHRVAVLAQMTRALNTATSRRVACEIIVEAAQKLLGWDACYFHRYNAETQDIENILSRDTLNGQIVDVPMPGGPTAKSPFTQAILREGPRLVLREPLKPATEKLIPFGDTGRRSESLMFVPVRESGRTIGLLSIQSYTLHAYDATSLATLQSLVEHGAGALDRIQSREVLQTHEQQFRSLIENTSDMIAVVSHDGRVGFQSPSVERGLGYRPEELTGRNVMDLIHPEDVAAARAALVRAMTPLHKPKPFEGRVRHRDGSWRRLQVVGRRALEGSGAKYQASGPDPSHPAPDTSRGEAAIILNARDVTESRALEEQFLQSQRMEAIGQLAGGVAHDFNNLLAIIQMQVDQLKLERDHTPAQEEFANEIGKAAQRGANLTRQLLMFSRRQPAKLSDLDLNEVVGRVMKLLQRLLGADVRMQVNYAPHPLTVHADSVMVDQVLLNLAVNARDAMPQGGRLIIETSGVEFDSTRAAQFPPARPGRFACLSVSDNGKGIRPEILPHIFEPFFTTKAVGKGTGLGLATVFGIVQQHEGWINVASELGAGSTFRIYLPLLTQSSAEPVVATPPGAPRPGHETILLAEDETALRELVHTILSRLGYRVLEAPSGVVALKLWEDHRHEIQLLLTDIVMPDGVNGLELAQRLLAQNPNLKVIFMSGYSQDIAGPAMTLVEGENFLAKPFQAAQLVRLIRAQLESPTIPVSAPKVS